MQQIPAIITRDRDGTVIGWNGGAEALLGYAEAEALGSSADLLLGTVGGAATVTDGPAETSVRAKNGRWVAVVRTSTILFDAAGDTVGNVDVLSALSPGVTRPAKRRSAVPENIPIQFCEKVEKTARPQLEEADQRLLERLVDTAPGAFCSFHWSRQ